MSTGSAQQTSTTTAGVSPFAQNYVDAMLGAGQQEIFNTQTDPATGKMNITGIKPYTPFGAPMNAQGQPVSYGGQQNGMGWGAYGQQQGGYGQPGYFGPPPGGYGYGQPPATQQQAQQQQTQQTPATQQASPMDLFQQLQNLSNRDRQPSTYTPTPQQDFGTYGFDQNVTDYLNKQRQDSAFDGGVAYDYDPATQTFKGATMGGPVTKTLDQIKQEAAGNFPKFTPTPGVLGMGSMPGAHTMEYTPEQAQQEALMRSANPYFAQQRDAQQRALEAAGQAGGSGTNLGALLSPNDPSAISTPTKPLTGPLGGMGGDSMMANLFGNTPPASVPERFNVPSYMMFGQQPQQQQYQQPQQQQYQQQYPDYSSGYAPGTMQAGMGPGEQLAAESSVAGPSALQQRAYQSAYNMQTPGQYGEATDIGRAAGLGLLNTAGQAQGLQSLAQQAIQQGKQYGQDITNSSKLQQAMDPFMQNVVNSRQREAIRQSNIMGLGNRAAAVKAGAYGGSRQAIMEAERQRNLATQLGDIEATGLQSAYQNAQQQMLNAQNQAMQGYNTGIQGYNQGIAGQTGAYGQAAGAGTALSNIGGQQLGSQQSIANLQNTFGQQQQQRQQQIINQAMQNYNMRRLYPQQQLTYMNSLLSGLPVSSTGQVTNIPAPNMASQIAGLGMTGIGAAGLYQNLTGKGIGSLFGFKKGGQVKRPQVGGNGLMDAALRKIGA
jgi:hypothetical protein